MPSIVGLSVGTRPDCVPPPVLDLLAEYRALGHEVWLELGLQSSFDETLARVNRGHGFAEYAEATRAARARGLLPYGYGFRNSLGSSAIPYCSCDNATVVTRPCWSTTVHCRKEWGGNC